MPENKKPKIAITMGDPAGIGPEICLIALQNPDVLEVCTPFVFGDAGVLVRCADEVMLEPPEHVIPLEEFKKDHELFECGAIVDVPAMEQFEIDHVHAGMADEITGRASYRYIEEAIESALEGRVQGITTAPINKEAIRAAGVEYPGHTEMFADKLKAERSCMMLTSEPLTCSFVTVHVGYDEVPKLLTVERILE
ncbi:MAG: 4-hydroxythreonine-4-phosphate dehydrogenase PdxA, partial [Verrucomicrobiota bacterium]